MTTPTVDAQSELIDSLKDEVIRVGAERDAALVEVERLGRDFDQAMDHLKRLTFGLMDLDRPSADSARLDLLESRLVRAFWVECGRGRLFRLTLTDGRCFEGTTARGAIDAAAGAPAGGGLAAAGDRVDKASVEVGGGSPPAHLGGNRSGGAGEG